MNHPERILRTVDRHLTRPARLILYGRAALALGYHPPQPRFAATLDVDAILPSIEMESIENDDSFWDAISKTNDDLAGEGLYLTHLFVDHQVILRRDWLAHLSPINLHGLERLSLARPATEDLLLTKMMRIDPQDREDMEFLISHLDHPSEQVPALLQEAVVPPIDEIREAFQANASWLLANH